MAERTKIEWADATFNAWLGCQKVSAGCKNCYAELYWKRLGLGPGERRLTSTSNWKKPRVWDRRCAKAGIRWRVFCNSLADVFDPHVPDEWRDRLFQLVLDTPNLDWLILTKRPGKMKQYWGVQPYPLPNAWFGVSAEDQEQADKRIPILLDTPAAIRFVSAEPLLKPLSLWKWLEPKSYCGNCGDGSGLGRCCAEPTIVEDPAIDWVICGGESGLDARPMMDSWAQKLRDECVHHGVPFFFKQWGEWRQLGKNRYPIPPGATRQHSGSASGFFERLGKRVAGRKLDGKIWDQVPVSAAIRTEAI